MSNKRIEPGKALKAFPAGTWNRLVDHMEAGRGGAGEAPIKIQSAKGSINHQLVVFVRNSNVGGKTIYRHEPVPIRVRSGNLAVYGDMVQDDEPLNWQGVFYTSNETPVGGVDPNAGVFAVALETIPPGKIGRAVVSGPCWCR
jgi:hypothetical protein